MARPRGGKAKPTRVVLLSVLFTVVAGVLCPVFTARNGSWRPTGGYVYGTGEVRCSQLTPEDALSVVVSGPKGAELRVPLCPVLAESGAERPLYRFTARLCQLSFHGRGAACILHVADLSGWDASAYSVRLDTPEQLVASPAHHALSSGTSEHIVFTVEPVNAQTSGGPRHSRQNGSGRD